MQLQESFEIIEKSLWSELELQNFSAAEELNDKAGRAIIFKSEMAAYSVLYNAKRKCFELRKGTLTEDKTVDEWQNLSTWLFELTDSVKADAVGIANDFTDIVKGPKMTTDIKSITKPAKKKKNEDGNVDLLFFYNRLAFIFPELKDDMNQERIVFGKVRFAIMAKEVLPAKIEYLANSSSDDFKKFCETVNDMYQAGDIEVRGTIIHGIFNNLSDSTMEKISANLSEELAKIYKHSKKLKGKKIAPNKPKKRSKVVAAALENANKKAGK